jgi:hypothetical protein
MSKLVGLVGRTVQYAVRRGDVTAPELCEVVACQAAGEYGYWRMLVVTHDGTLLSVEYGQCKLVAEPDTGPYR